jgi:hypothetical protein
MKLDKVYSYDEINALAMSQDLKMTLISGDKGYVVGETELKLLNERDHFSALLVLDSVVESSPPVYYYKVVEVH